MDFHSKKVLITGINGLTGVYLSTYFTKQGFEVFGLSNSTKADEKNIFNCDLGDLNKLQLIVKKIQPEIIIHLAAISFVGHKNLAEFYEVNVIGTQNLLEAAKLSENKKLKKIILASSATVYGNQLVNSLSEKLTPNPLNHYGISKLAMEQVAKTYFNDLPIIIVRPFNYTAPEQNVNFVIPKIANAFNNKLQKLELGNIEVFREYNSIHFICECYYKLAMSTFSSEIVNLCTGKTYSLKKIITLFNDLTKFMPTVLINPEFVRKNEIVTLSGNPKKLNSMVTLDTACNLKTLIKEFIN